MRTIGLIGGMSWESTAVYYRRLNQLVRDRLGGLHSARIVLHSVDFAEVATMQKAGEWAAAERMILSLACDLKRAGADFIVLATNTMHKVADGIETAAGLPLLHIVDVTADRLRSAGRKHPLLLATRFTMEEDFVVGRLRAAGLNPVVPDAADRAAVHRIIYEELCQGRVEAASKAAFLEVIARARTQGIDSIILGCTEIGLALSQADTPELMLDTTEAHVEAAVELALTGRSNDGSFAWPIRPSQEGFSDAVSLWRLRNMTEEERTAELGPARPRSVFQSRQ